MARLKTWADGDPFSAADANSLALEVPAAATAQVASVSIALADPVQFGASTTPPRVGRQGMQAVIEGSFVTKTANYLGGGFRKPFATLPEEFWPRSQLLWLVATSEGFVVIFILGVTGVLEFRINAATTHPANMHTYFSVAYSVKP